jgi:hypothetical protein
MTSNVFRFQFDNDVPLVEAEMSLHLSIYAVEGLFGQAHVRLEASYYLDEPHRVIIVDGTSDVGSAVVRVFTNLLLREFGEDSFRVRRVGASLAPRTEGRAA